MTRLNLELDLDPDELRAARELAAVGSSTWRLLGLALARIDADEATTQATEHGDCAIAAPQPELGIESWTCLEHDMPTQPKDGNWVCPRSGGHRADPSAAHAEADIVLDLDPATLVEGQGVHVTYFDDSYIGRVELSTDGTVRVNDDLVGPLRVWSPAEGRALGVTGLRAVTHDEARYLGQARTLRA